LNNRNGNWTATRPDKQMTVPANGLCSSKLREFPQAFRTQRARVWEMTRTRVLTCSLSEREINSIKEYAAAIAKGLDTLQTDFESRERLMDLLDVQVTLGVEDGQKVAYVRCNLGNSNLLIAPFTTCNNAQRC
jgi:hypothetical protein